MQNNKDAQEKEALQYTTDMNGSVRCSLCNHRCHIPDQRSGRCGVRRNHAGRLIAGTYARVSAEAVDPIEKKPLYHFLPGTRSYSLGSIGCNFSCSHCQNWHISQPELMDIPLHKILPEEGVRRARSQGCSSVSWTYNEPTIWYEYTRDMGEFAHREGLKTVYVTNGYMTEDALNNLAPFLDAWRVDLKAFSDRFYRSVCKARLQPVLDTTIRARELGLHIETVTLIIPGLNDDLEEIGDLIDWVITNLGSDTPMHFTRFHPDFHMTDRPATPVQTLEKIYKLAKEKGLNFPYLGNVGGHPYEHTYCPSCEEIVIRRAGYSVDTSHLQGIRCDGCGASLPFIR
ncbi:MAG: AmmeMemoRadiSam system radical SAM enzyme [Methanospirillum sp.]|uniref:AmmeMemoRadiSam system radical SAM enzyme n=1 Tax=Methanospirillum sp. TaxID=45200 RepID=UPI00237392F3|nr:AmmeMemoRadiSam system radical SAM enzyme [Methanospirillum sp.]MDD1730204.1 AmmeMemoRadiSam system radical SAM enzyme [Methanospirillum sp.]